MLRLGTIVIGVDDVERAVAFWSGALGFDVVRFEEADDGFTILRPADGDGTRVAVHRSEVPAVDRPRIHLDLVVDSAGEQRAEVDRLLGLGATQPAWVYPDDPDFVVLADPAGNRFCIVDAGHR